MANLVLPVGIPGSGKSTWATAFLGSGKYSIVSSDDIRRELFGSLRAARDVTPEQKKENNARVWDVYYRRVEEGLRHNVDIFADSTNLRDFARNRLHDISKDTGASIHCVVFDNVAQALVRNTRRPVDLHVPPDVMDSFRIQFNQAKEDVLGEGYDSITVIGALH